ncbi:SAM-dependent methyltransferase [Paraburkholderia madseniana]|uniref:SAM-dependent methyltransferase n=1 Tax=Paraburkholderia madseniana TaxID=2599607 RepID=UPI0015C5556A|nr:SAM-dependent methyltransferase [Paraburkholderia madseniana]NPT67063.1 methyltransferase domain-containing protein [Paraburkholderia madseniana]
MGTLTDRADALLRAPNKANPYERQRYFDLLYSHGDDPWRLRERWYERRKHALTIAMLPRERYRNVFEPGCANGELSAMLAPRCDALLAADLHERAVRAARERLAPWPGARVERCAAPQEWPEAAAPFDLIIVSELAYYLAPDELQQLAVRIEGSLDGTGCLLACDWRHGFAGRHASAEAVHACFASRCGVVRVAHHVETDVLIDVWTRDGRSVAQLEQFA